MLQRTLVTLAFAVAALSAAVPSAHAQPCTTFGHPYASSEFMFGSMIRRLVAVTFTMAETGDLACSGPPFGGSVTGNGAICTQFLTAPATFNNCSPGVVKCHALVGLIFITGYGGDPTQAGPHSCMWNCGACGSFTINEADGLPVELLDFGVH
jgi:peptidoglycan/LPS O-acetylase OafA/YrhL